MWESAKAYLGNSLKHTDNSNNDNNNDNTNNTTYNGAIDETSSFSVDSADHRNTTVIINTTTISAETATPVTIGFTSLNRSPRAIKGNGERNSVNGSSSKSYNHDIDAYDTGTAEAEFYEGSPENMNVGTSVDTTNGLAGIPSESPVSPDIARLKTTQSSDLLERNDHWRTPPLEVEVLDLIDSPPLEARAEVITEGAAQHHRVQGIRNFFAPVAKSVASVTFVEPLPTGVSSTVRTPVTDSAGRKRLVPFVVVQKPSSIVTSAYNRNPEEFTLDGIHSRFSSADGSVTYVLKYKDGHTRKVLAFNILEYVSMEELERFENDLFDRNENMETDYYPKMKPPGGNASGGTAVWMSKTDQLLKKIQMIGKQQNSHKHNNAHSLMVQARAFEDSVSSNDEEDDVVSLHGQNLMMGSLMNPNNSTRPSVSMTGANQSQSEIDFNSDGTIKRRRKQVNYNLAQLSENSTPGVYFHNGKWTSQPPRKRKRGLNSTSDFESNSRDSQSNGDSGSSAPVKKKPGRPLGWKKKPILVPPGKTKITPQPVVTVSQSINIPPPHLSGPQIQQSLTQSYSHTPVQEDTWTTATVTTSDDESCFAVEKIVASRIEDGQRQFCVKWLKFPDKFNEWLPESSLVECGELVEEFRRHQKKKREAQQQRQRELTSTREV